eukprot:scaffold2156_cov430-Prasinococcus_capsulatus_cf.AAC.2
MSSRPLRRQCLRNGSTSKPMASSLPSRVMVCASRSTRKCFCASASAIRARTSSNGRRMGSMPFLKQLL